MEQPTPDKIKAARKQIGITQTEAASIVHVTLQAWQMYESTTKSRRKIPLGLWELFLLKTKQKKLE